MIRVEISTGLGAIVADLYEDAAPATVANFVGYVDRGAYTGGAFSRSVSAATSGNENLPPMDMGWADGQRTGPDGSILISVIQAGPAETAEEHPPVAMESTDRTGLSHVDGALSMGRTAPDSATSVFFICIGDQPELDFGGRRNRDGQGFAAFGRVVDGMDVVNAIHAAPVEGQRLTPPVTIHRVRRVDA